MDNAVSVIDTPDVAQPSPEDPLLRAVIDAPQIARCMHDCKQCIVMAVKNREGKKLSRVGAAELQNAFDRQSLGWKRPADEYTSTLIEEENSLNLMKQKVKGCHQIESGTRLMTETLLHHSEGLLRERLHREKALYVGSPSKPDAAPLKDEAPFNAPVPRLTLQQELATACRDLLKRATSYFA